MHEKLKHYALVICLFVFLFVVDWEWTAFDSSCVVHWGSLRHPACSLCFQSLVRYSLPGRKGAYRTARFRDHPVAQAIMRLLLRLLLLLVWAPIY